MRSDQHHRSPDRADHRQVSDRRTGAELAKAVSDQQQRQNYDLKNFRSDMVQLLKYANEQDKQAFLRIGRLIDAKEKSGFFKDISDIYDLEK